MIEGRYFPVLNDFRGLKEYDNLNSNSEIKAGSKKISREGVSLLSVKVESTPSHQETKMRALEWFD